MSFDNTLSKEDKERIIELSKDPNIHNKIIKSIAPSWLGPCDIKEAIALQLFGGTTKQIDGESYRGEIRILIVGDKGIGKSKLFQNVLRISRQCKFTQPYDIESELLSIKHLQFNEQEFIEIYNHYDMILAMTTPKEGNFNEYKPLIEQIVGYPNILDYFDLVFIVNDKPTKEEDLQLAEHILNIHQTQNVDYKIELDLLIKYINYARHYCNVVKLTDEANAVLKEFYVSLRQGNENKLSRITLQQLETTIRLTEASAKIKLKDYADKEDAQKAVRLMLSCLKGLEVSVEWAEVDFDISKIKELHSKRNHITIISHEIHSLKKEYKNKIPLNILYQNINDKYNLDEEKVKLILETMNQKGLLYFPYTGYLTLAE